MKKLLGILSALTLTTTTSINVVACGDKVQPTPPVQKIDISTKIPNPINLGQLSDNNTAAFKTTLQQKLITIEDLNTITTTNYDVYKAGNTDDIDNDISAGTSLNISC